MEKQVFANFSEYWYYAKHLTSKQRQTILRSLPKEQKESLEASYIQDGWQDLFVRNQLDEILSAINKEFGCDLIQVRCLVTSGKAVYVKKDFWEHINKKFNGFSPRHLFYIFGGYRAVESGNDRDEYKLVIVGGK